MALVKFRQIAAELRRAIEEGLYQAGERLPSEAALVSQYKTSRPTVIRALRELQQNGLIDRRVGSGTYVRMNRTGASEKTFGLLVPALADGEVFEPICTAIARESHAMGCSLLWGDLANSSPETLDGSTLRLCDSYIQARVDGVFFTPIEFSESKDQVSKKIVQALSDAGVAVVLLDRDFVVAPARSDYDLIALDNFHAGYSLAKHLLEQGCRRIQFLSRPQSADTIRQRIYGYQAAIQEAGVDFQNIISHVGNATDIKFVKRILTTHKPDAIICGNDKTAATFLQTLGALGKSVPDDLRLVGIDDLAYARLLNPPLTTMHQPCQLLAKIAFHAMLDRLSNPALPPRHITVQSKLIVRQSSTAR